MLIDVHGECARDARLFRERRVAARFYNPWGRPFENGFPISVCRGHRDAARGLLAGAAPVYLGAVGVDRVQQVRVGAIGEPPRAQRRDDVVRERQAP